MGEKTCPTLFWIYLRTGASTWRGLYVVRPHYRQMAYNVQVDYVQPPVRGDAWAGGTFFPVVLLCQFFVLVGNRFWFYIYGV